MKRAITASLLMATLNAWAGNLSAPFGFSSANVLPKGVRNLQYKGLLIQATDKFGSDSNGLPLGEALNQNVTWNKMLEGKEDDDGAASADTLKGYLEAKGHADLEEVVGETTGDVNAAVDVHIPVLAVGITDKLTMAVAVPIVHSKVKVSTGVISSAKVEQLKGQLEADGRFDQARELQEKYNRAVQRKLEREGYQPLSDQTKTEIGDIKLVAKYKLSDNRNYRLAIQPELTLPTGKEADINKAVSIPSGDGQLDVGASFIVDYKITDYFVATYDAGYIFQLADRTARRIPKKSDSSLSNELDYNIRRDLGDRLFSNFALNLNIRETLSLALGYGFQYKQSDKYEGDLYAPHRYDYLAIGSTQNMHSTTVGLKYSTIPLFRKKQFALPLEARLNHTRILTGKNVTRNPLTAFELSMFF